MTIPEHFGGWTGPGLGAALLLLVASVGCGAEAEVVRGPVRLVDHVERATIASSTALDVSREAALAEADVRFRGALEGAGELRRFAHEGAWVGPVVRRADAGGRGLVEAVVVPVEPGRTIRLRAQVASEGERGTLFGLELVDEPSAEQLADPEWVELVFREIGNLQRGLVAIDASADEVVLETVFAPSPATRFLLVGRAYDVGPEVAQVRFEVLQFEERGGWLVETRIPGRSPFVRWVTAARERRESLVLGVPGEARFTLAVPSGRARLSAAVTSLFGAADEELTVEVEVRAGGRRVGERATVRGGEDHWAPLALELERLAGRQAEVTLSVTTTAGRASEALVAIGAPILEGSDAGQRLDVVVISLDTARADRMSVYGHAAPTTPTLERLAEEAVVFENAITTASWTLPAHVSLFSGQYPDRHRVFGPHSVVAADTPWLAEEFQRAGYVTTAFTGGGYVNPEFGFARGFDRYAFDDPAFPPLEWTRHRREVGVDTGSGELHPPRSRTELARLLGAERRAPLFLFVHSYAAHNYAAGPDDLLALGAAREDLAELVEGLDTNRLNRKHRETSDEEQAERLRARARLLYDASLRVADRLVADVLAALRESGRLERTIVVVLSDHGEELFDRGQIGHGGPVYEELARVPLIVRVPRLEPSRVPDVVSLTDVAPTLRELCGLPRSASAEERDDGVSLVPLLRGESQPPRAVIGRGDVRDLVSRCLRSRDLKILHDDRPGEEPRTRLFHLSTDPGEQHDLAAERADDARSMAATLVERVERLEALGPLGVDAAVSGEVLQKLRELGYLGD